MGPQVTSPQSLAISAHAFLSLSLPLPHHNSWWFHCLGGWLSPGPRSRSSLRSSPTILSSTLTQPKTVILLISANHPFPAPHATTTTPLAPQCPQPFHPTWSSIHGPLHLFTTPSSCYHAHTCFFIQHSTNSIAYHWTIPSTLLPFLTSQLSPGKTPALGRRQLFIYFAPAQLSVAKKTKNKKQKPEKNKTMPKASLYFIFKNIIYFILFFFFFLSFSF